MWRVKTQDPKKKGSIEVGSIAKSTTIYYNHYNHCYHYFPNLLPSDRQAREDPQKKGNIESGRNEKLELIFFSGRSPEIRINNILGK